jgi:hypothetical protein
MAEDSGVHARIPASTAIAAARLTSSPTPNVSGCASRGRLSFGLSTEPSGAILLPPFDDDGATPYLRSIASRCFRALLSRYARIFSDATSDLAPLILPWIFAFSASDSPCGASPALLLLLPEA